MDQATWDKLLDAYRQDPGNHSAASRLAVVQRRTARRAYEVGYPDRPWGAKPIRVLLMEERELARSRLQLEAERASLEDERAETEADRDRERARQHALRSKTEEAVLVSGARGAVMKMLAATIEAVPGVRAAMKKMGDELEGVARGGPLTQKEMASLSAIGRRFASTLRDVAAAGQMAMEMERLYLGEPTEIVKVETELDGMPLQDLVRMAGYQDGVLRRAQERGIITIDPEASPPLPPAKLH